MKLEHSLQHSVSIRATRATVFRYFTDPERFARWWGDGSHIDPRPGGTVRICYPNRVVALGEVVEIVDGERIVFTYGYEDPSKPVPPGGSLVTVTLHDEASGTRVDLRHDLADATVRDHHVPGWRYQMALFANVVAAEQQAGADAMIDRFFACWAQTDAPARRAALAACATADVTLRDAYGCVAGREQLDAHIAAVQMHMAGTGLERNGAVRQCQGTALADWRATGPDGAPRGQGTNVFELAPDGRIAGVVGLWG